MVTEFLSNSSSVALSLNTIGWMYLKELSENIMIEQRTASLHSTTFPMLNMVWEKLSQSRSILSQCTDGRYHRCPNLTCPYGSMCTSDIKQKAHETPSGCKGANCNILCINRHTCVGVAAWKIDRKYPEILIIKITIAFFFLHLFASYVPCFVRATRTLMYKRHRVTSRQEQRTWSMGCGFVGVVQPIGHKLAPTARSTHITSCPVCLAVCVCVCSLHWPPGTGRMRTCVRLQARARGKRTRHCAIIFGRIVCTCLCSGLFLQNKHAHTQV